MSGDLYPGATDVRNDMPRDPIVDEVRRVREAEAAKHNFDITQILLAAKKRQRRSKRKVVTLMQKKIFRA